MTVYNLNDNGAYWCLRAHIGFHKMCQWISIWCRHRSQLAALTDDRWARSLVQKSAVKSLTYFQQSFVVRILFLSDETLHALIVIFCDFLQYQHVFQIVFVVPVIDVFRPASHLRYGDATELVRQICCGVFHFSVSVARYASRMSRVSWRLVEFGLSLHTC